MTKINDIFGKDLTVLNVGLASMAQSVSDQGVQVIDLDWQPPKDGVPRLRQDQIRGQTSMRPIRKWSSASSAVRPFWLGWESPGMSSPACTIA